MISTSIPNVRESQLSRGDALAGTYNVINEERGGDKRHFESDELVALFALLRRQRIIRGTGVCTRYHRRVKNSMENHWLPLVVLVQSKQDDLVIFAGHRNWRSSDRKNGQIIERP
ncbi:MAG: hypothetical protein DMF75_10415 [Acidobacteria bacterium]|nr:MAG: hypothetical protein DMF75_10415 [Acidobacteriota bacterium]